MFPERQKKEVKRKGVSLRKDLQSRTVLGQMKSGDQSKQDRRISKKRGRKQPEKKGQGNKRRKRRDIPHNPRKSGEIEEAGTRSEQAGGKGGHKLRKKGVPSVQWRKANKGRRNG